MESVLYDFTRQDASGAVCTTRAWAKVPERLSPAARETAMARAAELLKAQDAVLVAHYYVDGDLQDLALATGGIVADSLEMARFGRDHAAQTLVVVDEAYLDLVDEGATESMIDLVRDNANVVVLRTFSKAFGLAGLRVGYALACAPVTRLMSRVKRMRPWARCPAASRASPSPSPPSIAISPAAWSRALRHRRSGLRR